MDDLIKLSFQLYNNISATHTHTHTHTHECDVAYIVPDISSCLVVRRELEPSHEAGDGHVILLGIETAQTKVCEEF